MALTRTNIEARMQPFFTGEHGKQLSIILAEVNSDVITLKAWADTLVAKLNLDAGVTDANYAVPTISINGI